MANFGVHKIFLLIISLVKYLESTRLLADLKKCGDLECETLISRVLAVSDYTGPDCRYLNFTKGEEISVYIKLSGEREDLWAGSKGKDFGFFPRDAVQIEEVFISDEVELSTKESDFLCLFGVSYMFENEDSKLDNDNAENGHPSEEDIDQKYGVYESDFQIEPGFYTTSESTLFEDQTPEAPKDIRSGSESKDWEDAEMRVMQQDHIPEVDYDSPPSNVPEAQGWFALAEGQSEEKAFGSVTERAQESLFRSRKMVVEHEHDLDQLNNGEPQTEPGSEFNSVPEEQPELALEPEPTLKPQSTGWFGSGFTSYLGFGEEDTELNLFSKDNNLPQQDNPNPISSDEEATVPCMETLVEKEDIIINDSSILKSSWLDLGFGMLGFVHATEDKIVSEDGKNEDSSREDKQEETQAGHASEPDPDKEQEIEMTMTMETEDHTDKEEALEKTDDSDTTLYLKKFFNFGSSVWSFQNNPKERELPLPKQTMDQDHVVGNDETEKFSIENYPPDNMKDLMTLENRYSQSETTSKIESSTKMHEEVYFKTSSSADDDEKSKFPVDSAEPAQLETDRPIENTLLDSQMASSDLSLSPQNYIPPKSKKRAVL
ncbi:melanoma inhibitory activity protein 2-like [Ctenodactylus gundi]